MTTFIITTVLCILQFVTALAIFILGFGMLDGFTNYGLVFIAYSLTCPAIFLILFNNFKAIYHRILKYLGLLVLAGFYLSEFPSYQWFLILVPAFLINWLSLKYLSKISKADSGGVMP